MLANLHIFYEILFSLCEKINNKIIGSVKFYKKDASLFSR